ncbi:AI-2E family transporter [Psychrobium sp. 1_MG-2023]|uniref:AI-2E family transporter n=1 Tax=Psychrobium sp. 1_MG-2023 TaxID=3062624 RepID=UPI000C337C52|nr:AI-2E family transporter [Psychrobium sp. 1_MG-2023]MDP2560291.1 AI-2E family transporter [Psychrobium sp. 1_MG-2023]PKF55408.1 AI-2E family transporter [Alteromonadales bacterium alter-6D02]
MLELLSSWYKKRFSDPHAVTLVFILVALSFLIYFFANILMPLLVAIVVAYLLERPVVALTKLNIPRTLAVVITLTVTALICLLLFFGVLPSVWQQVITLTTELPDMLAKGQQFLMALPDKYPDYVSAAQIQGVTDNIKAYLISLGEGIVSQSFKSLVNLVALMIYVILVPLLIFFFLKDKRQLIDHATRFIPNNRRLAAQVWSEMNVQIINYIRGKVIEIVIVGGVSYIAFSILGLAYATLLAVLVGLSVLIPFIGAAIVTVPVCLVGLFQWGFTAPFGYLMLCYAIIQALDGNLLVPLLFSEAVNLHPTSIIVAVLLFGGMWGFWGVFFAIPLATLVKAVINAMSKHGPPEEKILPTS